MVAITGTVGCGYGALQSENNNTADSNLIDSSKEKVQKLIVALDKHLESKAGEKFRARIGPLVDSYKPSDVVAVDETGTIRWRDLQIRVAEQTGKFFWHDEFGFREITIYFSEDWMKVKNIEEVTGTFEHVQSKEE